MKKNELYSLISLRDFKAILGIDDREDTIAKVCLINATMAIEKYCKRKLLQKKHCEKIEYSGETFLLLQEYPVVSMKKEQITMNNGEILDTRFYSIFPDFGDEIDLPCYMTLSNKLKKIRDLKYIQVIYNAGYSAINVPADLASACLELAAWNLDRYRGRQIEGKEGMPLQVRQLLEPYKRKVL